MKRIFSGQQFLTLLLAAVLIMSAASAKDFPIDPANPNNGLTDIYSATFDPPLDPNCTGAPDPAACAFFNGQTPATREIVVTPTPTGVEAAADTTLCVQDFSGTKVVPPCPAGTLYSAATPSTLNLTLSAGNTQLAITGGNVFFPNLNIVISGGTASETIVPAEGASIINFAPSAGTVPIDGNGVAIIEVDIAPATAADFATFTQIVTNCTGPLCALIPILTLDMNRYRLIIDWDPTFSFFTADFVGQTANNSMVFATLNSAIPDITVTDSVPPIDDLFIPYGSVTESSFSDKTVTITNNGGGDLNLGTIMQPNSPFSITDLNTSCSGQVLNPSASCTMTVRFFPLAPGSFNGSFDIQSNDPDENPISITLSGTGTAVPVPSIVVTDSIAPVADLQIPFGDITEAMFSDQTVTINNNGNSNLVILQIAQANTLTSPFSIPLPTDNCSGQTIAPAAPGCTVLVRFSPIAVGSFTDSFDIPSNDPDNNPVTMSISGTGIATAVPDITVTDPIPPLDDLMIPFGDVTESTARDRTITITNDGNANLTIGMIAQGDTLVDPFSILNDNCSAQIIAPASSCTVDVRFLPVELSTFNDSFDIPSDDPDEPVLTFSISGTGVVVGTGTISLKPDGANSGLFGSALRPVTLLALLLLITVRLRRHVSRLSGEL